MNISIVLPFFHNLLSSWWVEGGELAEVFVLPKTMVILVDSINCLDMVEKLPNAIFQFPEQLLQWILTVIIHAISIIHTFSRSRLAMISKRFDDISRL